MRLHQILAGLLMIAATVFAPFSLAEVNVTKGGTVGSLGPTVTFTILDASGKVLGQATVPANQAMGSSLAAYFSGIAQAINEVLAAVGNQAAGMVSTASKDVDISSKVKVNVSATGTGSGGGGGNGQSAASPN